jgi:hypothetical protein
MNFPSSGLRLSAGGSGPGVLACRVEWVETPTLKDDQTARLAYKSGLRIVKLLGHVRRDKQRNP